MKSMSGTIPGGHVPGNSKNLEHARWTFRASWKFQRSLLPEANNLERTRWTFRAFRASTTFFLQKEKALSTPSGRSGLPENQNAGYLRTKTKNKNWSTPDRRVVCGLFCLRKESSATQVTQGPYTVRFEYMHTDVHGEGIDVFFSDFTNKKQGVEAQRTHR